MNELIEQFATICPIPLTEETVTNFADHHVNGSVSKAIIILSNLEDHQLIEEIIQGNFDDFDLFDRSLFNDGHQDMIEELALN